MKKSVLTIELIPKTCWFSNVRTMISKKDWDHIRYISYKNANNICEICSEIGKNQGHKHNLECHEIWRFNNETKTQILVGLISLCPECHLVKHFGRAIAMGHKEKSYKKLMSLNNWTKKQVLKHIEEAYLEYTERSKIKWSLDISLLTCSPYDLTLDLNKTRIFKVKKYKKKRRKSRKIKTPLKKSVK